MFQLLHAEHHFIFVLNLYFLNSKLVEEILQHSFPCDRAASEIVRGTLRVTELLTDLKELQFVFLSVSHDR